MGDLPGGGMAGKVRICPRGYDGESEDLPGGMTGKVGICLGDDGGVFVLILRMAVLAAREEGGYLWGIIKTFIVMDNRSFLGRWLIVMGVVCALSGHTYAQGKYSLSTGPADSSAWFCGLCGGSCDTLAFDGAGNCAHCGMSLVKQTFGERRKIVNNYKKTMTICFYLQDGVEILDFAGPMEVFSYAGFKVYTVSRTKGPIVTQGILKVMPDYAIEDAPAYDILAFFGGNAQGPSKDSVLLNWIRGREATTQYYFSVCTGAFIIGRAGLLDGLTATTFHASIGNLRDALPKTRVLADTRFVDNGKVITTAGISAGIDGALHLVAKLKGEGVAREVAQYMEYDKWVPGQGLVVTK